MNEDRKPSEKAMNAVTAILNNLRESDFVSKFGFACLDEMADYGADMALDIDKAFD